MVNFHLKFHYKEEKRSLIWTVGLMEGTLCGCLAKKCVHDRVLLRRYSKTLGINSERRHRETNLESWIDGRHDFLSLWPKKTCVKSCFVETLQQNSALKV